MTGRLDPPAYAAMIAVRIGVSRARYEFLKATGAPIPPTIELPALVDSGATWTSVDYRVIKELGCESIGLQATWVPGRRVQSEFFRASIYIGDWSMGALAVLAENLSQVNRLDALIGRDVLRHSKFLYDARQGMFSLQFLTK